MKATMYLGFVCLWIFLFSSAVDSSCKYFMHLFFCFDFKFLTLRPSNVAWSLFISFFLLIRSLHTCFKAIWFLVTKSYRVWGHLWMRVCFIHSSLIINTAFMARSVSKTGLAYALRGKGNLSVSYLETSHQMVASSRLLAVLTLVR